MPITSGVFEHSAAQAIEHGAIEAGRAADGIAPFEVMVEISDPAEVKPPVI